MVKFVNEKKQMVKIYFGFYGDKRYGCNYDTLKENLSLSDLMQFYTTDVDEFKIVDRTDNLCKWCPEIPQTPWGESMLPVYAQLRYIPFENSFHFCLKIGE